MSLSITEIPGLAQAELTRRRQEDFLLRNTDAVDWMQSNFYIPETRSPIELLPHQQGVLRYALTRLHEDDPRIRDFPSLAVRRGHFPFRVVIWSTPKKRGKSTVAGGVGRYIAETQTRFGEVYHCGNDLEQAKDRSFKFITDSIRLTPGCVQRAGEWVLPKRYVCQKTRIECLETGTIIKALSTDARGEAGGNPDLTIWTELWGFTNKDDLLFWEEMKPVPGKPDSMRWVETYAGFEDESKLLRGLYELGLAGRQLTAGQLAEVAGVPLDAFAEAGDPESPIPVYVHESAGLLMYWDEGEVARRFLPSELANIEVTEAYYREEAKRNTPSEHSRHHLNQWTGSESDFVPMVAWDRCKEALPTFEHTCWRDEPCAYCDSKAPVVLGVDAATTGDCFAIVAVTRHPSPERHEDVAIRAVRKWDPREEGGVIDYWEPEAFLRALCQGGCIMGHPQYAPWKLDEEGAKALGRAPCDACLAGNLLPAYRVYQISYDTYQLVDMMQRLTREQVAWCEPVDQGKERLKADRGIYDLIVNGQLAHDGNLALREHVANARAKHQKDEDSKLRIIKKTSDRKIDLLVAASMATLRCKYLLL